MGVGSSRRKPASAVSAPYAYMCGENTEKDYALHAFDRRPPRKQARPPTYACQHNDTFENIRYPRVSLVHTNARICIYEIGDSGEVERKFKDTLCTCITDQRTKTEENQRIRSVAGRLYSASQLTSSDFALKE